MFPRNSLGVCRKSNKGKFAIAVLCTGSRLAVPTVACAASPTRTRRQHGHAGRVTSLTSAMFIKTMAIDPLTNRTLLQRIAPEASSFLWASLPLTFAAHPVRSVVRNACLLAVVLVSLVATESFAESTSLELIPASPKSRETILLRVSRGPLIGVSALVDGIFMAANKITVYVVYVPRVTGTEPPAIVQAEVVLGQLPAGTYDVEVRAVDVQAFNPTSNIYEIAPSSLLATTQLVVRDENIGRARNAPRYNYTDLWWDPNQPGWGMNIMVKNDQFFATWFVYDAAGRAAWYTMQGGQWRESNCYAGPIQKMSGPPWGGILGLSGGLSSVTVLQAGTGDICFPSYNSASFFYTVEGMTQRPLLSRQPF